MHEIADVVVVPGVGGFFFDDQAAVAAGAPRDGLAYAGPALTPGYRSVRQPAEAVSVLLVLDDGQVAHGDCVSVQYSGVAGREPLLDARALAAALERDVVPRLRGRPLDSFRRSAALAEQLTAGRDGLGRAAEYGLTQALLHATALARKQTMADVIRDEWGLAQPMAPVPIYAQTGEERRLNVDKMVLKRVDALPHGLVNTVGLVGAGGSELLEYVRWVRDRVLALRDEPAYSPVLHFDVYGTLGVVFGIGSRRLTDFLLELEGAAAPFALRVEHPVDAGTRDGQIDALATLRESLRARGSRVELVADEWANTLDDIRAFAAAQAVDMLHVKTPDLGGVQHSVEAVLACSEHGIAAHIGGSCCETERAAQVSVHVALASGADQILAKPGMGVDEGHSIVVNEMRRALALSGRNRQPRGDA